MLVARRFRIALKRTLVFAASAVLTLVLVGIAYEQVSRRLANTNFPPPGTMLSVDGYDTHLNCAGEGSPVVILESGLTGLGSMQWYAVQPAVEEFTTICAYDRAGILWTKHRNRPRTGAQIVEELGVLLDGADVSPPYVFVGHSAGGVYIRMYDSQFPDEILGFVFIDSSHPDQLDRLPEREIAPPAEWQLAALGATGLIRLMSGGVPDGAPAAVQQAVQAHSPNSVYGLYAEMASIEVTMRQAGGLDGAPGSLGSRPVIVLTRGRFDDTPFAPELFRHPWIEMQTELAALSDNSDHRLIDDASHFIHLDDPDAVVLAIRDVVTAVRNRTRLLTYSSADGASP
jgi:pimeloyl-ACP methyl ester carboxylesterase